MKLKVLPAIAALLFIVSTAVPARADVILTPFIGGLFGGNLSDFGHNGKMTYGASLAAMGKGVIGAEVDFSWTPELVSATDFHNAVREASITGNLIVGIPIGGTHGASIRPYVVGGVGLLRATEKESDFTDRIHSNDFAWDLGGGIMGTFNSHIGVRGDVRYFQSTNGVNDYKFLRGTGGIAIKF